MLFRSTCGFAHTPNVQWDAMVNMLQWAEVSTLSAAALVMVYEYIAEWNEYNWDTIIRADDETFPMYPATVEERGQSREEFMYPDTVPAVGLRGHGGTRSGPIFRMPIQGEEARAYLMWTDSRNPAKNHNVPPGQVHA